MKKLLLLIATCLLLANSEEVRAEGFYTGATAGVNWLQNYHKQGVNIDFDSGFAGTAVGGYGWDCGLRLEGEVGYHYNKIHNVKFLGQKYDIHGRVQKWSTMANVLYNLPVDFCVQPYVGAGIGYAWSHIHVKDNPTGVSAKANRNGFTYQLIGGVEVPVTECVSLDAKYRYQKTAHLKHDQSVELGLVYAF